MKRSPSISVRLLVPFLAASTLVFGVSASEVADAGQRRVQAPRKVVAAPKPEATQRQIVSNEQAWSQVSGESVNIRLGPGTNFAAVGSLKAGEFIKARAKQNGWLEIDWPSSLPAWVEKSDVKLNGNGSEMGIVSDRFAKVYSIGNVKSNVLAQLPKGAPVEILGEQGTWYKVKAPATATAYISQRFAVMGVGKPQAAAPVVVAAAPAVTPAKVTPTAKSADVAAKKTEVPVQAKRAVPADVPAAPQPTAKAVLPAPTAPAAVAPEEPKKISVEVEAVAAPAPKLEKPAALKPVDEAALEETAAPQSIQDIVASKPVVAQPEEETAAPQPVDLGELAPLTSISSILEQFETAKPVATEEKPATEALKVSTEAQSELAKAIEETKKSLKTESDAKGSIIDDNLQALETARVAAEQRRMQEEAKQRESLKAALDQFGEMETKRRSDVEAPLSGKSDERTGSFLPVAESAESTQLKQRLQDAFEADQARVAVERERSEWTAKIEQADAWRAGVEAQDMSRAENDHLQLEESARIEALLAEDAARLQEESARAQELQKLIQALESERKALEPVEQKTEAVQPAAPAAKVSTLEQDVLRSLETARKAAEATTTKVIAAPETTAFDKVDTSKTTQLQQNIAKALEGALKSAEETQQKAAANEAATVVEVEVEKTETAKPATIADVIEAAPVETAKPAAIESAQQDILKALEDARKSIDTAKVTTASVVETPLETAKPAAPETTFEDVLKVLEDARKTVETAKRSEVIEETAKPKLEDKSSLAVLAASEEKYGVFLDPAMAPAAKSKPVEEIRALMFPSEKSEPAAPAPKTEDAKEPVSSLIPDIGNVVRKSIDEAAKTVPMEDIPAAAPVTTKPQEKWDEPGVEVIAEPEGSLAEDFLKETNKRVKGKFVVPTDAPAAFGRRAEVIRMDQ